METSRYGRSEADHEITNEANNHQEASLKVITINEFDVATVKCMVSFLYAREYHVDIPEDEEGVTQDAAATEDNNGQEENDNGGWPENDGSGHNADDSGSDATNRSDHMESGRAIERLLRHLQVNAIANYYDIPGLLDLAKSNIEGILRTYSKAVPRILREISTSNAHTNLYPIVATAVSERSSIKELFEEDGMETVELDTSLSKEIAIACGKRINKKDSVLKCFESLCTEKLTENAVITTAIDTCLTKLSNTSKCRHCGHTFACIIQSGEEVEAGVHRPTYTLRCRDCRTRHM